MSGDIAAANILPPPPPPVPSEPTPEPLCSEANKNISNGPEAEEKTEAKSEDNAKMTSTPQIAAASDSSAEAEGAASDFSDTKDTTPGATTSDDTTSTEEAAQEQREEGKTGKDAGQDDYDSDEAVGKEEAARDQNLDDDEDDSNDDVQINPYDGAIQVLDSGESENAATDPSVPANKVTVMFQRLLNMNENQSGQMVIRVAEDGTYSSLICKVGAYPSLCAYC